MAGDTARAESLAQDLGKRFPLDTQMQSLWLRAIQTRLALDRKNPTSALNTLQAASAIELGGIPFGTNISCLHLTYIRGEGLRCRRRVSENHRPQRHRVELLDWSVGASGRGPCQRLAVENFARSGRRCRPSQGDGGL